MTESRNSLNHNTHERSGMAVVSSLPTHFSVSETFALDKLVPGDAEAIFRMVERNPDIPKHVAFAKDIANFEDVLPNLRNRSNETMDGRYAIKDHGELVGSIWVFPGDREAEFGIGYCLDQAARGKGYVTQAVLTLLQQLRDHGASEVYFQIIMGNEASTAIPERLGCESAEIVTGIDFPVAQQRWRLQLNA